MIAVPTAGQLAIQTIVVAMVALQREAQHQRIDNSEPFRHAYDYIVVGAGTAGCVVARRLSDQHDISVLLVEAGGPQRFLTDVPGMETFVWAPESEYNWNYRVSGQTRILQGRAEPGVYPEPKGRVLGGSSTVNRMLYARGNPRDFDNYEKTYGAVGWSFKDVLPFFVKSENNTDYKLVSQNPGYHGTEGLLGVARDPNENLFFREMLKSYASFGIPTVDQNGPTQNGAAITQVNTKDGLRSSTANAYIDPNPNPKNLFISVNSHVTKILLDDTKSGLTAVGVEFVKNGHRFAVRAKREVIVSAGTYGSPQILMLSGIGPKSHLNEMDIPVLADLPVGKNLQDHPQVPFWCPILNNTVVEAFPQLSVGQLYQMITEKRGPLATTTALYAFFNTKSNPDPHWPNIVFSNRMSVFSTNIKQIISIYSAQRAEEWAQYFGPYLGQPYLISEVALRRPRSFGTVRLASKNPFQYPIINPNFFYYEEDMDDVIEAIKFQLYFLLNSKIADNQFLIPKAIPGCKLCKDRPIYECDSYIRCHINQVGMKEHHSVGTCRMGSAKRSDTVVDPRLRVKNVSGLRVCDASVFPRISNSNTNANTIVVGEKCAQYIKEEVTHDRAETHNFFATYAGHTDMNADTDTEHIIYY